MKRFLSILICVLMLTSITAMADDYDLLGVQYTGYEAQVGFSFKIDNADVIAAALPPMAANMVNVDLLADGLSDSTFNGTVKLNSNADYTKAKISYELTSNVPIKFNRNAKITTELAFGMWLDWDITDELNPKMDIIYAMPSYDKYISADLVQTAKSQGANISDIVSSFKSLITKENIADQNAKFIDIIRKNSEIKANASSVRITANAAQAEEIVAQTAELIRDLILDNKDIDMLTDGDNGFLSDILPTAKSVRKFFEKNKIFSDEALSIELAKTKTGMVTEQKTSVNLSLDVSEITGNSSNDRLGVSFASEVKYKNINGNVNVNFPTLNSENSVTLDELTNATNMASFYGWDTENCIHDEGAIVYCDTVPNDGGELYISLDALTDGFDMYGHDYDLLKEGNDVTVIDKSANERFSKATFTLGSAQYSIDGRVSAAAVPAVEADGETYIDTTAARAVFGINIDYAERNMNDGTMQISLWRRSPLCHHTQEEIDAAYSGEYTDDYYCEHYQAEHIYSDAPYNGTKYVPLREIAYLMTNSGEPTLTYDNGVVTFADLTGTESFKTLVFTVGSNVIYKDGEAYVASAPVAEYDDVVYIDAKTAKDLLGFDEYEPSIFYNFGDYGIESESYSATFARKNPACKHSDDEIDDYYKWWE